MFLHPTVTHLQDVQAYHELLHQNEAEFRHGQEVWSKSDCGQPNRAITNFPKRRGLQLRIDAGELVDGKRNVYLQVNSQAKATGLKDWVRRNGTHANLASATFDTTAADLEEEADRVLEELEKDAKKNV